jgi:hypothetical protein
VVGGIVGIGDVGSWEESTCDLINSSILKEHGNTVNMWLLRESVVCILLFTPSP